MRHLTLPVALLFAACIAGQARADAPSPLCEALEGLTAQAVATGEPQRIRVGQFEPMTAGCGFLGEEKAGQAFCDREFDVVGVEYVHSYPWTLRACLNWRHYSPHVETRDEFTGTYGSDGKPRQKIVRMTANLDGGVGFDLTYVPAGENDPAKPGLYGHYDLVVWKRPGR